MSDREIAFAVYEYFGLKNMKEHWAVDSELSRIGNLPDRVRSCYLSIIMSFTPIR